MIIKSIEELSKTNLTDPECIICLEKMYDETNILNDTKLYLLECNHIYHNNCIIKWINKNNTCPTCRKMIKNDDDYDNETSSSNTDHSDEIDEEPNVEELQNRIVILYSNLLYVNDLFINNPQNVVQFKEEIANYTRIANDIHADINRLSRDAHNNFPPEFFGIFVESKSLINVFTELF